MGKGKDERWGDLIEQVIASAPGRDACRQAREMLDKALVAQRHYEALREEASDD